ncbi:hypothetical protein Vretimale_2615 [Volvox reticuliferus]|uniref:Uncharacterized protein n=1 Tax=Volvox reticuliferus TaxID=1737510 RepID=A0A8J4D847_9CHLO|nr:hypothetical protein Vretifemale_2031 [Volvox reticuliferus]GIL96907.1 hypothetical protein Vretimale_2615 [Volvox reticuliferus]
MVFISCLIILLNVASHGVAVAISQTAADVKVGTGRDLWDHGGREDNAGEVSLVERIHGHVEPEGGATGASWQSPRGRKLAGKRRRRSVFQPNRPSAYVSLSKVRPFTGDVHPSAALVSALETRSFRRELILVTDSRPRAAMQLYDNLAQLGLVHVLWLTNGEATCKAADALLSARADLRHRWHGNEQQLGTSGGAVGVAGGAGQLSRRALRATLSTETTFAKELEGRDWAAGGYVGHSRVLRSAVAGLSINVSAAMITLATANEAAAKERRSSISGIAGAGAFATSSADLGCAWYNQAFPDAFIGHRRLMLKRLMLMARVVRQGYNLLSLDTDVIVFREPYSFLKHPPYSSAHMLVGKSIRGGSMVNTGVMYFQNVSRTGPVSWLLSEAVERNLRWMEHTPSTTTAAPLLMPHEADKRGCWDQFLLADAVLTSITGKISLYYCARPPEWLQAARVVSRRAEEDSSSWNTRHRDALGLVERQSPTELMAREVTQVTDPDLLTLVGAESFMTTWTNLTVPHDPRPLLSDQPGYELPSRKPDGLAAKFHELLAEDDNSGIQGPRQLSMSRRLRNSADERTFVDGCRGVEVAGANVPQQIATDVTAAAWHTTAVLAGEARARVRHLQQISYSSNIDSYSSGSDGGITVQSAVSGGLPPLRRDVEMLVYASDWLVGGWTQRGTLGYWDPALTHGVPRQVFAHLVRAPGPTNIGKEAVRMQYGEYDWELAALVDGGPFPFLSSADATELPRVVALLPNVDTSTQTQIQWINMARGLAQLSLVTGRRVVWPAIPCASKWVQPNPGSRRALPLNYNSRFLASGTFSEGLMCTPAAVLHQKCLYERLAGGRNDSDTNRDEAPPEVPRREGPRGLLPIEFEMLLRLLPPSATEPGPHNTVHLQSNDDYDDGDGGERPVMFDEPPRTEGITYVKASSVVKPLREGPLATQPVLYIAQRTFLTQLEKLGDPDLMAKYRTFRNECPALR